MLDFEYAIFPRSLSTQFFLVWSVNVCFGNDRNTPTSTVKAPVTVDELQELIKLLAKYVATHKGQNLQKTDPAAHALLVKWNKFQLAYKKTHRTFPSSNRRSPGSNPARRGH